jgi:hypothetical protein
VKAFRDGAIQRHFWTPLPIEASTQLVELENLLTHLQTISHENDKWRYIWNSEDFIFKKAYLQIIGVNYASPIFKWMWKPCVMGKHKFFFWLLLKDRLNTRGLLKRKNMDLPDYNCVLFNDNMEEDLMHLFFECSFNKWCWKFMEYILVSSRYAH